MRHRKLKKQLNRTSSHTRAMFANMSVSLIKSESMVTTLVKAKHLRRFFEPLVTRAANDTVAHRRYIFSKLRDKEAVYKLFSDLGPHYKERPGGYIRILKKGFRNGDNAPMAYVGLVDREKTDLVDTDGAEPNS